MTSQDPSGRCGEEPGEEQGAQWVGCTRPGE
jgi:hypothetical protein